MFVENWISVAITLAIGIYILYQFIPLVASISGINPVIVTLFGLIGVVLVSKYVMSVFA